MPVITLVGDVHGKIDQYQHILEGRIEPVIQLGDMGVGFSGTPVPRFAEKDKFIRGNHDSPSHARSHPNYLGDYGYLPKYGIFYLGGAYSIDYEIRQYWMNSGSSPCWWSDEELPMDQLSIAMSLYLSAKPRIVVSHEAPSIAGVFLLHAMMARLYKMDCTKSRTAQMLQRMFEAHQPDLWVFGHYHFSKDFKLDNTRFLCLNELEDFTLDTDKPLESFYE